MATRRKTMIAVLLLLLLSMFTPVIPNAMPVQAAPEPINEAEPNDSSGTAQVLPAIGLDRPVVAKIGTAGDVDWYAFRFEPGKTYTIELFNVEASLANAGGYECSSSRRSGIWPAVYAPDGGLVARECTNNAGGTVQTVMEFTAGMSGLYHIRVAAHATTVSGDYQMRILPHHDEPGAAWDTEAFEPNNALINAYTILPGRENALTSRIENRNSRYYTDYADVDWYRFEAIAGRTYTIELFNVANSLNVGGYNCSSSYRSGLFLWVGDRNRNKVNSSDTNSSGNDCYSNYGADVQNNVVFTASSSGVYYIRVMPNEHSAYGNYSIRILPRYDQPGASWDATAFEPNNRRENAYLIYPGDENALRSRIEPRNGDYTTELADSDWYRFEAVAGIRYRIELFDVDSSLSVSGGYNCSSSSRLGLWLDLYDEAVNPIQKQCTNNGSGDVQTFIEFVAGATGVYFINVTPHSNDVTGYYSLRVRPLFCETVTGIPKAECEALVTLYANLDGDNWLHNTNWLQSSTPCDWYGVQCNDLHVTALDLSNNDLQGELPPALEHLTNLSGLRLHDNPDLTGALSTGLRSIANPRTFFFNNTDLCESGDREFQFWLDSIREASRMPLCNVLIKLDKQVSTTTARPGDRLDYTLLLQAREGRINVNLNDTLPAGLTYVAGSAEDDGATYDTRTRQIRYSGQVSASAPHIITYQVLVDADIADGSILANVAEVTSGEVVQRDSVAVSVRRTRAFNTLLLIYYGGDNNLGPDGMEVLNSVEQAAKNPDATVLMMLDGPGSDNARLYRVEPDNDLTCPSYTNLDCDGRYVIGQNMWEWPDDSANPEALAEFIKGALIAYPNADQVILSLVGHGSGISAAGEADQPGGRRARFDPLAGLLLDEDPGQTSLSTRALGEGLRNGLAAAGRDRIDGLYLDACLMSMVEVGYEINDSVDYLLASPNIKWAVSDYAAHINDINGQRDARQLLEEWLHNEAGVLNSNHPFTYALTDLGQIDDLRVAIDNLALALKDTLPGDRSKIRAAFNQADLFDSTGDGSLNRAEDSYIDLASFARALQQNFAGNAAVRTAAQEVETALIRTVLVRDYLNGSPWHQTDQKWIWNDTMGGLSIYAPLVDDGWQRRYYNSRQFQFAHDGQWDDFLAAYWNDEEAPRPPDLPQSGHVPTTLFETNLQTSLPTVSIVASATIAVEGGSAGTFTISRTGDLAEPLTVTYTVSGTAEAGVDYDALSGSITIPANVSSVVLTVTARADAIPDENETVIVTLSAGSIYSLSDEAQSATVTIRDESWVPTSERQIYLPLVVR